MSPAPWLVFCRGRCEMRKATYLTSSARRSDLIGSLLPGRLVNAPVLVKDTQRMCHVG